MEFVTDIIKNVREGIEDLANCDPCETENDCCEWLHNELQFFEDLWKICFEDFKCEDFYEFNSIQLYESYISKQSLEYQKSLKTFIDKNGTGCIDLFNFRKTNNKQKIMKHLEI